MKVSDLKVSKFLTQKDFDGTGQIVTIKCVTVESVSQDDESEDKWVVWFEELQKGMVCNVTNGETVATITGSDDSDNWGGTKVVIYTDPTIRYGGKRVGGLRLRQLSQEEEQELQTAPAPKAIARPSSAPAHRSTPARAAAPATREDSEDDGDLGPQQAKAPPHRAQRPAESTVEEEDNVTEEKADNAPSVQAEARTDDQEPPPAIKLKAPPLAKSTTTDMTTRLDKLKAAARR